MSEKSSKVDNMKVLNLYAGIGGNRKLWDEVVDDLEVTAVEIEEEIAEVYQDNFPQDEMVIGDAHDFLKDNYEDYDFIWSSPPCPTHSIIRNVAGVGRGQNEPVYPDIKLYEEIIFLKQITNSKGCSFDGNWCVENVQSYYKPLIKPQKISRHYFWSNFFIPQIDLERGNLTENSIKEIEKYHGFDLDGYGFEQKRRRKIIRNCVHPELGKHILECAVSKKVEKLEAFCE